MANGITHVKLRPTLSDTTASVKVGKQGQTLAAVSSGSASAAIALDVGDNPIDVEVTAEDTTVTKTYTVTVTRAGGVPGPPRFVSLSVSGNDLSFSFLAPSSDGGAAITEYEVQYKTEDAPGASGSNNDPTTGWVESGVAMPAPFITHSVTGLTAGITYDIRVRAKNANGAGDWLQRSGVVPTIPGKPTGLMLTAGDTQLSAAWTAPASDGGAAITGYDVEYKTDSATDQAGSNNNPTSGWVDVNVSVSGRTATITGLTNGTDYDVRVRAENSEGTGDWSDIATKAPAAGATQSTDATLSGLTATRATSSVGPFTSLTFTPAFAAATDRYTANVANDITHVKLTPTVTDTGKATVEVGKQGSLMTVPSGSASQAVELNVGENVIFAKVTAEDTNTVSYYRVTVTRAAAASTDATLSGLTATSATSSSGPFAALNIGAFAASTTTYAVNVANSITHVKLTRRPTTRRPRWRSANRGRPWPR